MSDSAARERAARERALRARIRHIERAKILEREFNQRVAKAREDEGGYDAARDPAGKTIARALVDTCRTIQDLARINKAGATATEPSDASQQEHPEEASIPERDASQKEASERTKEDMRAVFGVSDIETSETESYEEDDLPPPLEPIPSD